MEADKAFYIALGNMFPADVVARTAHRYTGDFFVEINAEPYGIQVRLTPQREDVQVDGTEQRFRNDLLDDLLREKVRVQTAELHAVLAQAALRQAQPRTVE